MSICLWYNIVPLNTSHVHDVRCPIYVGHALWLYVYISATIMATGRMNQFNVFHIVLFVALMELLHRVFALCIKL